MASPFVEEIKKNPNYQPPTQVEAAILHCPAIMFTNCSLPTRTICCGLRQEQSPTRRCSCLSKMLCSNLARPTSDRTSPRRNIDLNDGSSHAGRQAARSQHLQHHIVALEEGAPRVEQQQDLDGFPRNRESRGIKVPCDEALLASAPPPSQPGYGSIDGFEEGAPADPKATRSAS
jgi:hypothetical protein